MVCKDKVLIIIVSTHDDKWLNKCFNALNGSRYRNFDIYLILNDNSSGPSTPFDCEDTPALIKYIEPVRKGFAECNNHGFRYAIEKDVYKYIFLLNPDTILHNNALEKMVDFLNSMPEYGIVGCIQYKYETADWLEFNNWTKGTVKEAGELGVYKKKILGFEIIDHYYVQGAALMMRSSLLKKIGMLDIIYVTFYEETDFCRRCLTAGYNIALLYDSWVKHYEGGNWDQCKKTKHERDFLFIRNQFFYYLSEKNSFVSSIITFFSLILRHLNAIFLGKEDVSLKLRFYPIVLYSFLKNIKRLKYMRLRLRYVKNNRKLPEYLWVI